jgi:hypothetical protein
MPHRAARISGPASLDLANGAAKTSRPVTIAISALNVVVTPQGAARSSPFHWLAGGYVGSPSGAVSLCATNPDDLRARGRQHRLSPSQQIFGDLRRCIFGPTGRDSGHNVSQHLEPGSGPVEGKAEPRSTTALRLRC